MSAKLIEVKIMYGYIYKTTNLLNGMFYIGRHKAMVFEPEKYIGSGTVLKRAVDKYGAENFKCELVETAETKDELNKKERYWITKYRKESPELLYNITAGGEAIMDGLRKIEYGDETKLVEVDKVQEYLALGWKLSDLETRKKYRRLYNKKWKKAHPERVRAAKLASQKRHPEKHRERLARYYSKEENRLKQRARVKKYYQTHKEQIAIYYKKYYQEHKKS